MIRRKALEFLDSHDTTDPFMMVLATPAPHDPFTPAPQYENEFSDKKAPRIPNFNYVDEENEQKHWFIRQQPRPLNDTFVEMVDDIFRNRWRTLLSVDDMVDAVMLKLEEKNLLDDTVVIFTSDHGYHLGIQ